MISKSVEITLRFSNFILYFFQHLVDLLNFNPKEVKVTLQIRLIQSYISVVDI